MWHGRGQWIVGQKKVAKRGKHAGVARLTAETYHQTLGLAMRAAIESSLEELPRTTATEMYDYIEQLVRACHAYSSKLHATHERAWLGAEAGWLRLFEDTQIKIRDMDAQTWQQIQAAYKDDPEVAPVLEDIAEQRAMDEILAGL